MSKNARVAALMGWKSCKESQPTYCGKSCELWRDGDGNHEQLPNYVGSITASMVLVDKYPDDIEIYRRDGKWFCYMPADKMFGGKADTLSAVIVDAFIAVKEGE